MAANLSNLLGKLTSGQQTTIDYLAGMSQSGSVLTSVATSWVQYAATTTNPPSNPNVFTFGAGSVVTIGFYGTGSHEFTEKEQTYAWQALSLWSSETGIRFKYTSDTTKAQVNFVHASDTYGTVKKAADTGTYYSASTGVSTGTTGLTRTTSGYINYDSSGSFGDITSYTTANGYGIDTLVHEAGHLFGLGHSGPYNGVVDARTQQRSETDDTTWSIMSYMTPTGNTVPDPTAPKVNPAIPVTQAYLPTTGDADYGADWKAGNKKPYSPMALDIFAAQRLNGAPALSTFAGGQTFGFNSNINYTDWDGSTKKLAMFDFDQDTVPVLTLYDYGTKNTLDLSKYTTASTVNLNDGTFSSIAGLSDNIFIEYGTQIDHLVGGAGDDVITANERSDVIDGGGGANLVKFSGARSAYVLSYNGAAAILTKSSSGAAYSLTNIQQVQFGAAPAVALADLVRVQWQGPSGGHFGIAINWSDGQVPGSTSQVRILSGANILVTQQESNEVDSLVLAAGATIDIASGRFVIDNAAAGSTNAGTIQVESGNTLYLAGGLTNIGTLGLYGGILQTYSRVVSLSGGGTVLLQGGQIGGRDASGSPLAYDTFTNVDNTISGFGSIGRSGFQFPLQFLNAENANVVAADGTLTVSGAITNDGIMGASNNGLLDLSGAIDQTNGGRIIALGTNARVLLDGGSITGGGIYSVAGTIEVATDELLDGVTLSGALKVDAGTKLTLVGDIYGDGATIDATAGAISLAGARLHGVTLKLPSNLDTNGLTLTDVGVSSPLSGSGLTLGGNVTNTSSIAVVGDSPSGKVATLTVTGTLVLTGGGTIRLYDLHPGSTTESYSPNTQVITGDVSAVLDNETGTIAGYGKLGNGAIGLINGPGGLIVATASTLAVTPGNAGLDNAGTIESAGGTLELRGTVRNAGGLLYNASGSFSLVDTAISGGTLSGNVFHTTGAVGLNNVTNSATVAIDPTVTVTLSGAITNANSLLLKGYSSNGWYSTLAIGGTVQLSGGGTVTMADTGNLASATQRITGTASDRFENVDNTISGYGVIGGAAMGFTNDAAGTVSARAARLTLDSGTTGLGNEGLMEAKSGGTLEISSTMANLGQVVARNAGTVILHKAVAYSGTIAAEDGGTIVLDGGAANGTTAFTMNAGSNLTVLSTGTIDGTVQAVSLKGTTTVQPTATLTLAGTIANAGFMTFQGRSSNGWYSTLKVQGTARLTGGGTVTLADTRNAANGNQIITGTGSVADTLDNVSDVITGYGRIGAGAMKLVNEYVIQAVGGLMVVDTGTNAVINTDLMTSATNGKAGTLEISSAVVNTGQIAAGVGGTTILHGAITGVGTVQVYDSGTLTLAGGVVGAGQSVSSTALGTVLISGTGTLDGTQNAIHLAGVTTVTPTSTLTLSGTLANAGTLTLLGYSSNGWRSNLVVSGTAVLTGGGTVRLADTGNAASGSQIITGTATDTLDNAANVITGFGWIGAGSMKLVNENIIQAQGGLMLVDTGSNAVINTGRLTTAPGAAPSVLEVAGAVVNTGQIATANGKVVLHGAVTGAGTVQATDGGTLTLAGGRLGANQVVGSTALGNIIVSDTGALDGTSNALQLAGTTTVGVHSTLTLSGTVANTGTLALTGYSSNGWLSTVIVSGSVVLAGGGAVTMADTGNTATGSQIVTGTIADTLDNRNEVISGYGLLGSGTIGLVNETGGTIRATTGTLVVSAGVAGFVNAGRVEATTGTLELHGTVSGGGTIAAAGGAVNLLDTTLTGQSLVGSGAGSFHVLAPTALASASLAGKLSLDGSQAMTLSGTFRNAGTVALTGYSSNGWQAVVHASGAVSLTGGGTVTMADTGNASQAAYLDGAGAGVGTDVLTNVDNAITGYGRIGNATAGFVNAAGGSVRASGGTMTLNSGSAIIANAGSMVAATGTLEVSTALRNTGVIDAQAAGTLLVHGVITNAGTIQAESGATLKLDGGTLLGGRVGIAAGANLMVSSTSAIAASTPLAMAGTMTIAPTATLLLGGELYNTGAIALNGVSYNGWHATLSVVGTATLSGGGTLTMSDTGGASNETQVIAGGTLDNVDNTIRGRGTITAALVDEAGATLLATGPMTVNGAFTNAGTLRAEGGQASIAAATNLANGVLSGGTWSATNGTIALAAALTENAATIVLHTGGAVTGNGTTIENSLAKIDAGASLQVLDGRNYAGTTSLANAGELRLGGGTFAATSIANTGKIDGTGTITAAITGAGTIEAAGGTLTLTGPVSGALLVDAGSTLVVKGGAAAGTTLRFAGPGATIQIVPGAGAQPFNGRVVGSTVGDTIDLVGIAATGTNAGSTTTLSYAGATIGTVTFDPGFVGSLASDGHGGTLITSASPDPLFDPTYYLAQNPDVAAAGIDPYQHYMTTGWHEGRNPSALFSTNYYLNQNADVRAAGLNPMTHFEASGWREGRDPSVAFSVQGYLAAYPDVKAAGLDPLIHYLTSGKAEGRQAFSATPHATGPQDPLVDAAYVYANNPAVAAAGLDASAWYHSTGWTQGANPDALFDTNFYLTQNLDVKAAGIDPLAHFEANGWRESREPSLVFSDAKYLAAYPDVKAAGLDPAVHYAASGKAEGRMAFLQGGTAPSDPLVDAAYFDKQLGATLIPSGLAGAQQAAYAYDHGGWQAGLNPHALFDTNYYLSHNTDVAAAHVDPLAHFEANGWREGRDPSAAFSTTKYLAAYGDVKAAGIDPLLHYVASGQAEGRSAFAV